MKKEYPYIFGTNKGIQVELIDFCNSENTKEHYKNNSGLTYDLLTPGLNNCRVCTSEIKKMPQLKPFGVQEVRCDNCNDLQGYYEYMCVGLN